MSLPLSIVVRMVTCVSLCAATVSAQQVRAVAGLGVIAHGSEEAAGSSSDDPGVRVEMFENPNLDNYLDRAQMFLDRDDYASAIKVLQEVVDGRTLAVFAVESEGDGAGGGNGSDGDRSKEEPEKRPKPAQNGQEAADNEGLSASNAVFSRDGRLYRPIRRLCHELLASMPDVGIQIYRTEYEFEAEELLAEAMRTGSSTALESVSNRYFVTLPSGRAMMLLADRLMHEGRYRASAQVIRDLLDVYPAQNRKALGIRENWCRFKIALCLQLAGEFDAAREAVQELAQAYPEDSLRISGQLESISKLPENKLFARDMLAVGGRSDLSKLGHSDIAIQHALLEPGASGLIPMWQHRFHTDDPYKNPKPRNRNRQIWIDGSARMKTMPFADRYGPGTRVAFSVVADGDDDVLRAVFLEHYRLRLADAASGLLIGEGDGVPDPPLARENHPRVRIAASDYALLRPVEDESHRYVIIGHENNTTASNEVLQASQLVAYYKRTGKRAWSSLDWRDGADGFRNVVFLAAPTLFGERLLLPSLRDEAYTLECIDAVSGKPLWHTSLHAGGTPFFKAPGCPVVVQGGIAFVATNAGCLAAVDALVGDLRWIRRYERYDAVHSQLRKKKKPSRQSFMNGRNQFKSAALKDFLPNDLVLHDSLVIVAPCDGKVLLAIDTLTGDLAWMLDGGSRYAPYGRLRQIIGRNDKHLFALSSSHLVCIDLDGGLLLWQRQLPSWSGPKFSGRGRGAIVGDTVVVPNSRELLVFDAANKAPMRRLPLPTFGDSREPLSGSCHVMAQGPYLVIGYRGGVEVFSSQQAMRALAAETRDSLRKAAYLTASGARPEAEKILLELLKTSRDEGLRFRASTQLLELVSTRAGELASGGDLRAAMAAMQEVREWLVKRKNRLNWHLARIELCKMAGDIRAHEQEQQSLYSYMEGRG